MQSVAIVYTFNNASEKAFEILKKITNINFKFDTLMNLTTIFSKKEDLEKAIKMAEAIYNDCDNPDKVFLLKYNSVMSSLKFFGINEALRIAHQFNSENEQEEKEKSYILSNLILQIVQNGEIEKAKAFLEEIKDKGHKFYALQSIVIHYLNDNMFDKALECLKETDDYYHKSYILQEIARNLIDNKKNAQASELLNQAFDYTKKVDNDDELSFLIEGIVVLWGRLENYDKALEAIKLLDNPYQKSYILQNAALVIYNEGNRNKEKANEFVSLAIKYASEIDDEVERENEIERDSIYESITIILANIDEIEKAIELANSIEIPYYKIYAIQSIVSIIDERGESNKAKELLIHLISLLKGIDDFQERIETLSALGYCVENSQNIDKKLMFDALLEEAKEIRKKYKKNDGIAKIAVSLAYSGYIDEAMEIVSNLENGFDKAFALYQIASSPQIADGEKEDQKEILNSALEIAKEIENKENKLLCFENIIGMMAYYEYTDEAIENALLIPEKTSKLLILKRIALTTLDGVNMIMDRNSF